MSDSEYHAVNEQLVQFGKNGETAMGDHPFLNPAYVYQNPTLFSQEKKKLFAGYPILAALSADLDREGSYLTLDIAETPVLLIRGQEGVIKAFVNACRHRGARLATGKGCSKNIVCPYHSWRYGLDGKLIQVLKSSTFGDIDNSQYGLLSLPVREIGGLIFVKTDTSSDVDLDDFLGSLAVPLQTWKFESYHSVGSRLLKEPVNWKLALDTFGEGYHLSSVHSESFSEYLNNVMTYDRFGKDPEFLHHRLAFARKQLLTDENIINENKGILKDYINIVYFIYPNTNLFLFGNYLVVFRVFPGMKVDESLTRVDLYSQFPLKNSEELKLAEETLGFVTSIVESEDYAVTRQIQRNIESGWIKNLTFGCNEPPLAQMHRNYQRDCLEGP